MCDWKLISSRPPSIAGDRGDGGGVSSLRRADMAVRVRADPPQFRLAVVDDGRYRLWMLRVRASGRLRVAGAAVTRGRPDRRQVTPVKNRIAIALFVLLVLLIGGGGLAIYAGLVPLGARADADVATDASAPAADTASTQQVAASQPKPAAAAPAPAPAGAAGAAQPIVTNTTYGDWVYTCSAAAKDTTASCSIFQRLTDSKSGSTIFVWRISRDPQGEMISDWQTPTGILVNRGIVLDAGTPKPVAIPFTACTNQHCEAVANLAADFMATLNATTKANATIYSMDGKGLTFPFSVKGLPDAIAALQH
jgi:invasion protein IalB